MVSRTIYYCIRCGKHLSSLLKLCKLSNNSQHPLFSTLRYLLKTPLLALLNYYFGSIIDDKFVDIVAIGTELRFKQWPRPSKSGNYTFKLTGRKRHYKLYGCTNSKWARNVVNCTQLLCNQGVAVPHIRTAKRNYILADWIDGDDIRNRLTGRWIPLYDDLVQYQSLYHKISPEKANSGKRVETTVCYIDDILVTRFLKFATPIFKPAMLAWLKHQFQELKIAAMSHNAQVSHPDFTHFNILLNNGHPVVIDNETLHCSRLWQYDILNTANIMFAPIGLKEQYLNAYSKHNDISSLYRHTKFWRAVWLIRVAGGLLQRGKTFDGKKTVAELVDVLK